MTSCDGADSTIIGNLQCSVPMTELVDDHSYVLDAVPKVVISAHNALGDGEDSDPNTTGAEVTTLPTAMATPTY